MNNLMELVRGRRRLTIIVVVLLVIAASWSGFVDRTTQSYVDRATVQALAAFATARGLNAVITVAKSVEVGAVVSFQPLEVLDPVHDLVEQYSSIMKLAIASLVTQKLLLEIVSTGFFKILLTTLGILVAASLFVWQGQYFPGLVKLFALAALIRFLFVLAIALNALVDEAHVTQQTRHNMEKLDVLSEEIAAIQTGGEMSSADREILLMDLEALEEEREEFARQIDAIEQSVASTREELQLAEDVLDQVTSRLGPLERYTDPERRMAQSKVRELKAVLSSGMKEAERLESQIAQLDSYVKSTTSEPPVAHKPRQFSDFFDWVPSMPDVNRFATIKDKVQNAVPTMLNLMALFVFKTLIMPLLFLYMLLRGFRFIWEMDLKAFVKGELDKIRAEIRMQRAP